MIMNNCKDERQVVQSFLRTLRAAHQGAKQKSDEGSEKVDDRPLQRLTSLCDCLRSCAMFNR